MKVLMLRNPSCLDYTWIKESEFIPKYIDFSKFIFNQNSEARSHMHDSISPTVHQNRMLKPSSKDPCLFQRH